MKVLGLLAKFWEPGQVKTRLARDLGSQRAADVYLAMLQTLWSRLATVGDRRVVAYWPEHRRAKFAAAAGPRWQLAPQVEGDLGKRLEAVFRQELRLDQPQASARVILIGGDCPHLGADCLAEAWQALEHDDVVLGPSLDGGYYLIGLARRLPAIFHEIAWSTPDVWPQTIDRLTGQGIGYHVLAPAGDVDDLDDLRRLLTELGARDLTSDPALSALAERAGRALAAAGLSA